MSILTRYLYRVHLPLFVMSLGVFMFVLLMSYFLRLFNLAVMKGISLAWIFFCFSRLLPYFLSLALPMAFLVSLLLALGQLSEKGEVTALRSSGFSFREILAPFFVLACLLTLLLFYVNHKASPEGFRSFRTSYTQALSSMARMDIESKTFTEFGEWQVYAETADREGVLTGVRLVKRHGAYKKLRVLAPEGRAAFEAGRGMRLDLFRGTLMFPDAEEPSSRTGAAFERYRLFLPLVSASASTREPELQEMNTFQLRRALKAGGLEPSRAREFATEATLRSAGAAAPFVLFWVACPLGLSLEKRSRAAGFALSLLVLFGYYGLLMLGVGLGRRHAAMSSWTPWLANLACLGGGAALWTRMSRR